MGMQQNGKQQRNTLFIGGNGINGGAQYIYNNNVANARQNTKESAESSKSRNGGLNHHDVNQNPSNFAQINIHEGNNGPDALNNKSHSLTHGQSPYKGNGVNKNRISAKMRNNEIQNSRNGAQNKFHVLPGENNTVDSMPKKNSFIVGQHGARGSQGNDNMMFQSFNQ